MYENNLRTFEKLLVNIKYYCYSTDVYMAALLKGVG